MSLFKKKDEDRKKAYAPTGDAKEKAGASGKGGGEPAKPKYDPKSKGFADIIEKRNNDGAFGYGYVDENTGIEVPWYIDMINGGGANAAGDTFVSPFAELPFEGGMLSAPSKISNAMNIAPYGYNQPRKYAQAGMVGYPELPASPSPASTGGNAGGSKAESMFNIPNNLTDDDMGLPSFPVPTPDPYGVGQFGEMTMPPSLLMTTPQSALDDLQSRHEDTKYRSPDYVPQKKLIEYADGFSRPMSTTELVSLMPPVPPSAAGPTNTTMTTPDMDFMYNMAKQTVMSRFPTMPPQEQELKAQEEYNRLMYAMGM